jgi:ABC-2 type transport system permease protein
MKKVLLVLKHEFLTVISRRSFILTLILIPLGGFLIMAIVHWISLSNSTSNGMDAISTMILPADQNKPEGFVDQSGIIKSVPDSQKNQLTQYSTEAEAKTALNSGAIASYYILPADYLTTGRIIYIRPDFNPIGGTSRSGTFTDLVSYWLVNGDQNLNYRLINPLNVETVYLTEQPQRDRDNMLTFFIPYGVTLLFYILIMSSASLMLSNVTSEKTNRMIEILMTSVNPTQMLTGKIIALGLAGVLQTVVWTGAGYLLLSLSGSTFNLPIAFRLPLSILLWGIFFFIGGYALYASLMAGVGALVPNLREAAQATMLMIIPLVLPLAMLSALIENPNGGLAVFLSLFPLTSPVSMMTRLAATQVPTWQVALSLIILGGSVVLLIRAAAGMFRAQNLLSGQPFKLKVFIQALIGKA